MSEIDLKSRIKGMMVENLMLKIVPEDIGDDQPLFGEGLGLDSIDALELIVLLQQHYSIRLANPQEGPRIFKSVLTIAEYIKTHQND